MSREVHVRFWEGVGVRFPHATRLLQWHVRPKFALWTEMEVKSKLLHPYVLTMLFKPFGFPGAKSKNSIIMKNNIGPKIKPILRDTFGHHYSFLMHHISPFFFPLWPIQ
jgi:hypothetical protein